MWQIRYSGRRAATFYSLDTCKKGIGLLPRRSHRSFPRANKHFSTSAFVSVAGTDRYDHETDVLIVGSGAARLTASLRAKQHGLRSILVEKSDKIGGASAYSGGSLWVPDNPVGRAYGVRAEDRERLLAYFEAGISRNGDPSAASSLVRRLAYLDNCPRMVQFLQDQGFRWHFTRHYPDYYPDLPGGSPTGGRGIEPEIFDLNKLGDWKDWVLSRPGSDAVPPVRTYLAPQLSRVLASVPDFLRVVVMLSPWVVRRWLLGQQPVGLGRALVAQLLYLNKQQRGCEIWRSSPMLSLVRDGSTGAVLGARVQRDGREDTVRARRGVLLCAGGFARNKVLRDRHGPATASAEWTSVPPGDTGDAITAGIEAGAATALMDDAWWGPTILDPQTGTTAFALFERARPYCIIVDSAGRRFMNEAESYVDAGHHQYERNKTVPAIPAWLIMDQRYRNRYTLGMLMARQQCPTAEKAGRLFKANTLGELANKIGVDVANLAQTVTRWNTMSRSGVDEDFGKGSNAYDRFFGDPTVKPNPSMGPVEKAPFYATQVYPGDLGTKGGLLTDEFARVVNKEGEPVVGLYGAGNTTASVMGRSYLGAGSTLGPACTFAYIAINHIAAI